MNIQEFAADDRMNDELLNDIRGVAPALAQLTIDIVQGELWSRPGLTPRDRSLVTIAALIARCQTVNLQQQFETALRNGIEPCELSEVITHLAFYAGWSNAVAAIASAKAVFSLHNIGPKQLPTAWPKRLPIDQASEAKRAARVGNDFGAAAPGVVHYTTQVVFLNLWLRPDLSPRDRSLATVSALIANGQVAQVTFHLNRAMDNGLRQEEASEALTQLAFHAGWPCVFSALPIVKSVFESRAA